MVSISAPSMAKTNGAPGMCGFASAGPVGPGVRRNVGSRYVHKNRDGGRPIRQLELLECLRNDRIRELMILRLVLVLSVNFSANTSVMSFLHIGRQRSRIGSQDSLTEGLYHAGLIDRRDRSKGKLVEQNVPARGAVRFDQNLEFRRPARRPGPGRRSRSRPAPRCRGCPWWRPACRLSCRRVLRSRRRQTRLVPATRLSSDELFDPFGS